MLTPTEETYRCMDRRFNVTSMDNTTPENHRNNSHFWLPNIIITIQVMLASTLQDGRNHNALSGWSLSMPKKQKVNHRHAHKCRVAGLKYAGTLYMT